MNDNSDDGSYSEAIPLGWQGHGIDWEVYSDEKPLRAMGYDEDVLIAVVTASGPRRLNRKMRRAEKAHNLPRNGVLG